MTREADDMLRIEINEKDCQVESREITGRDGTRRTLHSQTAYLYRPDAAYPDRCRVPLPHGQPAYKPGIYTLDPKAYGVGRFGDIEINRYEIALIPATPQTSSQARSA